MPEAAFDSRPNGSSPASQAIESIVPRANFDMLQALKVGKVGPFGLKKQPAKIGNPHQEHDQAEIEFKLLLTVKPAKPRAEIIGGEIG